MNTTSSSNFVLIKRKQTIDTGINVFTPDAVNSSTNSSGSVSTQEIFRDSSHYDMFILSSRPNFERTGPFSDDATQEDYVHFSKFVTPKIINITQQYFNIISVKFHVLKLISS